MLDAWIRPRVELPRRQNEAEAMDVVHGAATIVHVQRRMRGTSAW